MENEYTPPAPLLLMPASDDVTFNNGPGGNLLMPVTQESSMLSMGKA